jgi:hypothetical protein
VLQRDTCLRLLPVVPSPLGNRRLLLDCLLVHATWLLSFSVITRFCCISSWKKQSCSGHSPVDGVWMLESQKKGDQLRIVAYGFSPKASISTLVSTLKLAILQPFCFSRPQHSLSAVTEFQDVKTVS